MRYLFPLITPAQFKRGALKFMAALMLGLSTLTCFAAPGGESSPALGDPPRLGALAPYVPRFGRTQPVIAVVGENSFTELTDYVVPYGVLQASGVATVVALSTQPGPIQMFPALKIQPQATVAEFDARFPEGADFVIVPAVHRSTDAALLAWVSAQATKGARVVGVCDGVWVLAHSGLLKGRKAVGHWYAFGDLERQFPASTWVRNRRYIEDEGRVVTTTGVTASIPVSLALIEAVGGYERALATARTLGVMDWSPAHRSDDFKLQAPHWMAAAVNWLSFWSHEEIGVPVVPGIDEVALALTADAYSRTYRSKAVSMAPSMEAVRTRGGLMMLPDRHTASPKAPDRLLKPVGDIKPVVALDAALSDIAETYGQPTAAFVALQLEYPRP